MADYRAFLLPARGTEQPVLPYFGGTRVEAKDRRFQLDASGRLRPGGGEDGLAVGWWKFRIAGRRAKAIEPAAPVELSHLEAVRGHWADGWLALDGKSVARVRLPPDDEPPPLSRVTARRWYSGDLVFDTVDFEDDAEVAARRALELRGALGEVRGATPSLRVAFAIALGGVVARQAGTRVSPRELVARAAQIADGGPDAVQARLVELAREREVAAVAAARLAEQLRLDAAAGGARAVGRGGDPEQRADAVLDGARARMLACRRLAKGAQLDITYEVDGERVMSIVEADTLRVIDPGVCLGHAGEFRVLTLDAMPSVIREAVETHRLNILRWA